MAEINKDLFDALIKQQINLSRYGNKQAADMVSLLNAADADIAAKLLKWGESGRYTPARLRAILAEIKVMVADVYGEASNTLRAEMVEFAEHSAEVTGKTLAAQSEVFTDVAKVQKRLIIKGEHDKELLNTIYSRIAKVEGHFPPSEQTIRMIDFSNKSVKMGEYDIFDKSISINPYYAKMSPSALNKEVLASKSTYGGLDALIDHEAGHGVLQNLRLATPEADRAELFARIEKLKAELGSPSSYAERNIGEWYSERFALEMSGDAPPTLINFSQKELGLPITYPQALPIIVEGLAVNFNTVGITQEQINAILSKAPIRIGKDQSLLFGELFKGLSAAKEQKIRGAVQLGMVEGESIQQIVQRLTGTKANKFADGVNNISRRDLYNVTHSTVQHTNNQAAAQTMLNNEEVVKGFLSIVTLDSKSCLFCVNAASKEYKLTDTGPIWHIGCRCFRAPIVKTFKELGIDMPEFKQGTRASQGGQIAADTTYDQWLRTRPVSEQIEMLGPSRQKMFSNGMKVDKFVDNSGKTYTLEQLKSHK